jgi:hypothetical protein
MALLFLPFLKAAGQIRLAGLSNYGGCLVKMTDIVRKRRGNGIKISRFFFPSIGGPVIIDLRSLKTGGG